MFAEVVKLVVNVVMGCERGCELQKICVGMIKHRTVR